MIDVEAINKAVYAGKNEVAEADLWCPGTWVYDDTGSHPCYNANKAGEFLQRGGMGLTLPCSNCPQTVNYFYRVLGQKCLYQKKTKEIGEVSSSRPPLLLNAGASSSGKVSQSGQRLLCGDFALTDSRMT